ncbi:MAG: peptidoglycan-binding domain-containing protein [Pseudomonadota bacterium]
MPRTYSKALALCASALTAAGCSTLAADETPTYGASSTDTETVSAADLATSKQRISTLESKLADRERELAAARAAATNQATSYAAANSNSSLFPPNPKAGECYARVLIPAEYETVTEQIVVREAGERFEITPARYENVQETVLVKEASTRLEVVPAVYDEVQERVLVKPAAKKIVEVPAVYDTVTERVLDKPAHTAWKRGPAAAQTSNVLSQATTDTGEIMCLVDVPATYKTVEKRVLVTPAKTQEITIPAEYKTVSRTVVKTPATTREVTIPAQYDTVAVTKLIAPAAERRIEIPAAFETVSRRNKVTDEQMEWRQVVCEVNMDRGNVLALQRALADAGYYKAGVDGIIGGQTLAAARSYAVANGLPAGSNYVPIEVVKSLDLNF